MRKLKCAALAAGAALLLPLTGYSANVYVKSMKARIMAAPKFDSALLAEVSRGQTLPVLDKGDRWLKVRHTDKEGWISELLVSEEPLKGASQSLLDNSGEDISTKSRRRASAIATAGASRGLSAKGMREMYSDDGKNANYPALEKVEALTIDPVEAVNFIAAGLSGAKGGR